MPSVILECPHCGAEKMGFNLVYQVPATVPPGQPAKYRVPAICFNCEEMVVLIFENTGQGQRQPTQCNADPTREGWAVVNTYPKPKPSRCPSHTPDELKRVFLQAANALKRGDPDASGVMSRKVVDISTQRLLEAESGNYRNIYQRVEAVAAKGLLTPELKEWAHELRLGGGDAAHDLNPFTQEEADELLEFAELYLTYVYTLPNRLKERRARAEREKAKTAN